MYSPCFLQIVIVFVRGFIQMLVIFVCCSHLIVDVWKAISRVKVGLVYHEFYYRMIWLGLFLGQFLMLLSFRSFFLTSKGLWKRLVYLPDVKVHQRPAFWDLSRESRLRSKNPWRCDTSSLWIWCHISTLTYISSVEFSSVAQSCLTLCSRQASLSITNSRCSPSLTSIESVMPSSHLILCRPLLLLPPNPSQHQRLFQWVNSSHEVAKVLEFQL